MKKILLGILSIVVLFESVIPINAEPIKTYENDIYCLDTPYEYPVMPGSSKWADFESYADQVASCQIPDNTLKSMTTQALLETVLDCPLMIDMLIYDSDLDGYNAIYNLFNGLRELVSREDFSYEVSKMKATNVGQYSMQKHQDTDSLRTKYLDIICQFGKIDYSSFRLDEFAPQYSIQTVETPKKSLVTVTCNQSWQELGKGVNNMDEALVAEATFMKDHPNLVKRSNPSPMYNCHSYAWYSASTNNIYWMHNPAPYMKDGSYVSQNTPSVGSKIYQSNGKDPIHSGIVTTLNYANTKKIGIRAKCGFLGVFEYSIADDPYSEYATRTTYWKIAK